MKIALVSVPFQGEYKSWITPSVLQPQEVKYMPLGILSLATNIKGHDVVILDASSEGWDIPTTVEKINAANADVVGFSATTRRTYPLYRLLSLVQAPYKVVGGPHATHYSEDILARGADAVFVGNLADLEFNAWLNNPKRNQIIHCNTDINEIAYPDRSLMDYKRYFFDGKILFKANKRMPMFSSVGCPNSCKFCTVQSKKVSKKNPETVVEEMWAIKSLGAESIHILDDNFNISSPHVNRILNVMDSDKWNMEWSIRGQVRFDLSLIPRMKRLGLKRVHVGIEALDDNILKWLNKNQTVTDIENFCRTMRENDIEMLAYFIIGTPAETPDYISELPDKIRKLGIQHPFINILFPECNTPFYEDLLAAKVYEYDIWADFFKNPTPDFEIPPYFGYDKRNNLIDRAGQIIREFEA